MEYLGWDQVEMGAILPSFESETCDIALTPRDKRDYSKNNTYNASVADWRVFKPVYNRETCIDCQNCWVFCPDTAIISVDKKMVGIDYEHCKGCGVCAEVCPTNPKSLIMFEETVDNEEALMKWPEKKRKEK
ncbi:MAG: 4Fe-4S dicluster domain-containing protein [Epsilonproteobacteria bacterium]|nr:4Fe-4S dicluster domain-containing protein [Campylobacterota bacterium]